MSSSVRLDSSAMRSVSAYRISLIVAKCPCACRSSVSRSTHAAADPGTSPRTRRTRAVMRVEVSSSASAARWVSSCTAVNSASTCCAVARSSPNGLASAPSSGSDSQWYRSWARAQSAASCPYTAVVGVMSRTPWARARQSEIPRTRSALPVRASGPVPAGREAA